MKAAQITKYSKNFKASVNDIAIPTIKDDEILVRVKSAAVNPLEMLIMSGSVRLIQDYSFPLTIGNEIAGVVDRVGRKVTQFKPADNIYGRLPIKKIGGIAEYVAVKAGEVSRMPKNLTFQQAAAAALTGLTAYQALHEELQAEAGKTLFIPGGSGSFGQMAIPVAKNMGLRVIVSGNAAAKERTLAIGADEYFDYKKVNYWEQLRDIDYVIDTLGQAAFSHELSILRHGGKLVSLKSGPNRRFAREHKLPLWKQLLFGLVGARLDSQAKKQAVEYHFVFVRSDGPQLQKITEIIEAANIMPAVDPRQFTIENINAALDLVANGRLKGKVLIQFP